MEARRKPLGEQRKLEEQEVREARLGGEQQNYPGPRPGNWRAEEGAGGPERPSAPEKTLEQIADDALDPKEQDPRLLDERQDPAGR